MHKELPILVQGEDLTRADLSKLSKSTVIPYLYMLPCSCSHVQTIFLVMLNTEKIIIFFYYNMIF